ncbi:MAG TPA: RNA-protein complex protein Nop10 [Candidatus Thermoplasmatota archaeon]|nr:RNA-protein complex protein Nop10 [Candidatus Thermoplasmatota archaeon]
MRCAAHGYTLKDACPRCGAPTAKAGPAKYSPEDPYGKYRRQLKLMARGKSP